MGALSDLQVIHIATHDSFREYSPRTSSPPGTRAGNSLTTGQRRDKTVQHINQSKLIPSTAPCPTYGTSAPAMLKSSSGHGQSRYYQGNVPLCYQSLEILLDRCQTQTGPRFSGELTSSRTALTTSLPL